MNSSNKDRVMTEMSKDREMPRTLLLKDHEHKITNDNSWKCEKPIFQERHKVKEVLSL